MEEFRQLIEEMAELTQSIVKLSRVLDNDPTLAPGITLQSAYASVVEEISDVCICINEVIATCNCVDDVNEIMEAKIQRKQERINENLAQNA